METAILTVFEKLKALLEETKCDVENILQLAEKSYLAAMLMKPT